MTQLLLAATLSVAVIMFGQNPAGGATGPASMGIPTAEISNGQLRALLYLPDAHLGFYRSTRFDWSGVVVTLTPYSAVMPRPRRAPRFHMTGCGGVRRPAGGTWAAAEVFFRGRRGDRAQRRRTGQPEE